MIDGGCTGEDIELPRIDAAGGHDDSNSRVLLAVERNVRYLIDVGFLPPRVGEKAMVVGLEEGG